MAETNALLAGQEPTLNIEDEVIFLDSLNEVETLSTLSPVKMDYNAIVHCRRGRVLLELGGNQQVKVTAGQMLLKSVLGTQIDIWNRAMYLHETYVIDISRWSHAMESHAHSVFKGENLALFREFVLAFLRVYLLIVCEELLQQSKASLSGNVLSTDREKRIFSSFLDLLQHEQQKRRQVSYYAERLCITSKYLSTICRNVSGKSPMRWITDSVMEDCYALLRNTNLSVKEISIRLGFPNSSFFGQYFREQAAQTPMGYRNKYRSQL